jgi:histidinol-phosphate aminotransferase
MGPRIRADLAGVPGYVPGRTVEGAIKLASNEVSAGPLPSVMNAISRAGSVVNRYPDNGAAELIDRLAARFDVGRDQVAVGCGSVALCHQLVQITCHDGDEVLFPWRSFEIYPIASQVTGAKPTMIPLTEDARLDVDALLAAVSPATRLMFVCTPNNPTGPALRGDELTRIIENTPPDTLLVIDEAYREFVADPEVPDGIEVVKKAWAQGRSNVAVLRTFSKAYGLAGLRVGFCVGSEPVIEALRKVYVPFGVNSLAQVAAIASLDAEDELLARCRDIVAERVRVRDALLEMGYRVPDSQANFVWLPMGERTAEFNEHCLDHKVVVRAFVPEGVRVTVGEPAENDAFLAAARAFKL